MNEQHAQHWLPRKTRRFFDRPAAVRGVFLGCLWRLPLHHALLQTLGFRRLRARLDVQSTESERTGSLSVAELEAGLTLAARYLPWGHNCLSRSTVLLGLLRAHGHEANLRIGVHRDGQTLDGHAWVECDGAAVGPDGRVRNGFAPLGPVNGTTGHLQEART